MKKYFTFFIATLGVLTVFQLSTVATSAQFDSAKEEACKGLGVDDTDAFIDCENQDGGSTISSIIETALNILSIVAGVIAVILIIIGGLKYITSQGDSQSTSSARNTIIYAAVGLVIVALSQVIVRFVINEATSPPPINKTQPKGT
jgi:uncharacterized membrane protein YidH (DUF202 family)